MDLTTIITSLITALIISVITWLITFVRFQERVKNLEKKVDKIEQDLKDTRDKVIVCEVRIEERGNKGLAKNKSPIDLTEKGLDLLRKSGGQEWIITNRLELLKAIQNKEPISPYDVQEYAKDVLKDIVDRNDLKLKPLKDYAYKKGISLKDITFVMSIHLRNEVMPEFKGFNVADIKDEEENTP